MSITIPEAKKRLSALPKTSLGFFPTPLCKLERLSRDLGINLYIKRDDFTGGNLFGGNKTRKLEYLMGKAVHDRCEYVFTYGATQSNHAMQTAWAAAKCGLKAVLYLSAVVEPDESDPKANLLLDRVFGAEIHIVKPLENESFADATARSQLMGAEHRRRLEADGRRCMDIPMGGADATGSAAYAEGFVELWEQAESMGVELDALYHATGSGGTMAGLAAGRALLGSGLPIQSIAVLDTDETYRPAKAGLANQTLGLVRSEAVVAPEDFTVRTEYYAPGYERPNRGATEAIRLLAGREGLLLDPVYTGKAFAALLDDVRTGVVGPGSNVLFLHTGGTTALFAEKEILGDIF